MSAYLHVRGRDDIQSMRIGTNGAASFFAETLISGYAVSDEVPASKAKTVRQHWLHYHGPRHGFIDMAAKPRAILAISDDSEDSSWVRIPDMRRKRLDQIDCPLLKSLVLLWHAAETYYDWHPEYRLTPNLVRAVEVSTRALENAGSAWAEKCREAADLLSNAPEHARFTIG